MNFTRIQDSDSYHELKEDTQVLVDADKKEIFNPEDDEEELFDSNSQIANSLAHLDALKLDTIRNIRNIRETSEKKEKDRRLLEETRHEKRENVIQKLKDDSSLQFADIESLWASFFSNTDSISPLHLQNQIQNLELKYHNLLSLKNECINYLRRQLSEKDEEYVSMLKKQESNIDCARLLSIESLKEMKSAYRTELANIDESLGTDRRKRIEYHSSQVDQLEQKQQIVEARHVDELKRFHQHNREAIDHAYDMGVERNMILKDKLEAEIMELHCKVATSRRSYEAQVNYMEYEHRVKTRENKVYQDVLQRQKQWVKKYKGDLIQTRGEFFKSLESNANHLKKLKQESYSADRRTHAVEGQLKYFVAADKQRFRAILEMHLHDIETIFERIQQAERFIYEHILGICHNDDFVVMKKTFEKNLKVFLSKENLRYQQLQDEPTTLDDILIQNLDRLLSEYKSNVDEKRETIKSIQLLVRETQLLEEEAIKMLQSDLMTSLLYTPQIDNTQFPCTDNT